MTSPRTAAKAVPAARKSKRKSRSLQDFKAVEAEVVDPESVDEKLNSRDEDDGELRPERDLDGEVTDDTEDSEDTEPLMPELPPMGGHAAVETGISSSTDPVSRYMNEIGRYPLMTREQEHAVAIRYRETGDSKAAEQLVTSNLRFVVKVAAEYSKFGARLIDLVQEGNVGLMHAVKEFNPYKGTRLITYAVWWIRGYIQEYLMRQYSMVRIGTTATQRKLFYQLQRERDKLEREGLEQGFTQLSGRLGVSREEVVEMHSRLNGRDVSLDVPVNEDGSSRLLDLQTEVDPSRLDDELGHREELHLLVDSIEELRPKLNERELFLLDARLLSDEPMTLQEIGDKYGTTREAVRQMEARLLLKIKNALT